MERRRRRTNEKNNVADDNIKSSAGNLCHHITINSDDAAMALVYLVLSEVVCQRSSSVFGDQNWNLKNVKLLPPKKIIVMMTSYRKPDGYKSLSFVECTLHPKQVVVQNPFLAESKSGLNVSLWIYASRSIEVFPIRSTHVVLWPSYRRLKLSFASWFSTAEFQITSNAFCNLLLPLEFTSVHEAPQSEYGIRICRK